MNVSSKTVLIPIIVLFIGTVFGTSEIIAFADDPFKNKVEIDDKTKQKNDCDVDANALGCSGCSVEEYLTTHAINVNEKEQSRS